MDISTAHIESCRCAATGVFLTLLGFYGDPFCFIDEAIHIIICIVYVLHFIHTGRYAGICIHQCGLSNRGDLPSFIVFHPRDVKHVYTLTLASIMDNREVPALTSHGIGFG